LDRVTGEFKRRTPSGDNPVPDALGELDMVRIARREIAPRLGDTDNWLPAVDYFAHGESAVGVPFDITATHIFSLFSEPESLSKRHRRARTGRVRSIQTLGILIIGRCRKGTQLPSHVLVRFGSGKAARLYTPPRGAITGATADVGLVVGRAAGTTFARHDVFRLIVFGDLPER
jgi:hypothetical protein